MLYQNYDEYRKETRAIQPHTVEKFREKLIKKLDMLYKDNDFRSLEAIMNLSDYLATADYVDRCAASNAVMHIPGTNETSRYMAFRLLDGGNR